jgi:flagellar basal-body rod protein FlgF
MDPLTAIAASGLRARMESLDLLANNAANSSTSGYKADREFYSLYVAPEAQDAGSSSTMPLIESPWTDFTQGVLHATGNSLDLALSGKGFFSVDGPTGTLYTRNGNFRLDPAGKLVTADGYPVRGVSGAVTLEASLPVQISSDGSIQQGGQTVGQLSVADFPGAAGLLKQGSNYFRAADPKWTPAAATGASVEQGKLEDSNAGSAQAAISVVGIMRQFEMLQKAAQIGNDMAKQAIEQVARVGS